MKTITIAFTEQQLSVINQLLMQAPYGVAAPIVNHINAQIQAAFDRRVDEATEAGSVRQD